MTDVWIEIAFWAVVVLWIVLAGLLISQGAAGEGAPKADELDGPGRPGEE